MKEFVWYNFSWEGSVVKMFEMKCPYCGADLFIDSGLDTCYCQYCGGKILLEGLDDNAIKLRIKEQEVNLEKYKTDKKYEDIDRERQLKFEESKHREKMLFIIMGVCFTVMMLAVLFGQIAG